VRPRVLDGGEARLGDARRRPHVAVDCDTLGEVVGLDRAEAEAVWQWGRLRSVGQVAGEEVHERAVTAWARLAVFGEAVPQERRRARASSCIAAMISGVRRTYGELEVGAVYRSRSGRTVLEADNVWFTLLTGNVPFAITLPRPCATRHCTTDEPVV